MPIVSVQNRYSFADRESDFIVDYQEVPSSWVARELERRGHLRREGEHFTVKARVPGNDAVFDGWQPADLTLGSLTGMLPMSWYGQKKLIGIKRD